MNNFYNKIDVYNGKSYVFSGIIIGYCYRNNGYYLVSDSKKYWGFQLTQDSIDRVMNDNAYVEAEFVSDIEKYLNTEVAWVSKEGVLW